MIYICEFWGSEPDEEGRREFDKKFHESFKLKSTRKSKVIKHIREKYGKQINFDNLNDFGYRLTALKDA